MKKLALLMAFAIQMLFTNTLLADTLKDAWSDTTSTSYIMTEDYPSGSGSWSLDDSGIKTTGTTFSVSSDTPGTQRQIQGGAAYHGFNVGKTAGAVSTLNLTDVCFDGYSHSSTTQFAINNDGVVNLSNVTFDNNSRINGTGTLNIVGDTIINVTANNYLNTYFNQGALNIQDGATLTLRADIINNTTTFTNNGTWIITRGNITQDVLGNGNIEIQGPNNTEINNYANITPSSITVATGNNLINHADLQLSDLTLSGGGIFRNRANMEMDDLTVNANMYNEGSMLVNGDLSVSAYKHIYKTYGYPSTLEVMGNFYIENDTVSVASDDITTHGRVENHGTIQGNMTLLSSGLEDNNFYNYGGIQGNLIIDPTYNQKVFFYNASTVGDQYQIINNSGEVIFSPRDYTTGGYIASAITRTESGRGILRIGYDSNDIKKVIAHNPIEKQNIYIGGNGSTSTLNVYATIDDSSIYISSTGGMETNPELITNTTIENNGTLTFTSGTNTIPVTGTGLLRVKGSGEFNNAATINQGNLYIMLRTTTVNSSSDINLSGDYFTNMGQFNLIGATLNAPNVDISNYSNGGILNFDASSSVYAHNITNNGGVGSIPDGIIKIYNLNNFHLTGSISNNGTLYLHGVVPEGFSASGSGKIAILDDTNTLTVNNGVSLGNNSFLVNNGQTLYFNGNTLSNKIITGEDGSTPTNAAVHFSGQTINKDIILSPEQDTDSNDNTSLSLETNGEISANSNIYLKAHNINIANGTTLNIRADRIVTPCGLINDGVLNLRAGQTSYSVSGTGTTNITGNVIAGDNISNNVAVQDGATLTVNNGNIILGNTTINGELNLSVNDITADSSTYTGGSLTSPLLTLGENAALSLTITDPDALERGQQTGELSLINATYADDRDFATMFANNMYSVLPGTTLGKYIVAKLKTPEQIVEENGGTKNNVETGNSWDAVNKAELNAKAQDVYNELFDLEQHDAKGYIEKLNQIAPQGTQAVLAATQGLNNLIGANVAARVAQIGKGKAGGDFFTEGSLWLEALYSHANRSGDGEFSGNTYGANFGIDGKVADTTTLGFGYAFNSTKLDANTHDLNANGHTLFTYALYQPSQWYLRGLLNYGFAKYDDKNSTNSTDYNVQNIGVQIAGGYQIDEHWTPEAALRYTHLMTDDYTDLLGQKVKNDDNDVLTLVLGAKYETDIKTRNGFRWTPQAHLNLTYDIVSDDGKATVVLADQTYQINSKKLDAFGIEAGVGAEMGITDRIGLNLSYDFTLKGKFTNHTGALKGVYHF